MRSLQDETIYGVLHNYINTCYKTYNRHELRQELLRRSNGLRHEQYCILARYQAKISTLARRKAQLVAELNTNSYSTIYPELQRMKTAYFVMLQECSEWYDKRNEIMQQRMF